MDCFVSMGSCAQANAFYYVKSSLIRREDAVFSLIDSQRFDFSTALKIEEAMVEVKGFPYLLPASRVFLNLPFADKDRFFDGLSQAWHILEPIEKYVGCGKHPVVEKRQIKNLAIKKTTHYQGTAGNIQILHVWECCLPGVALEIVSREDLGWEEAYHSFAKSLACQRKM